MRNLGYLALALIMIQCACCRSTGNSPADTFGIALTYANDKMTDGAGAQLERIYSIYAVARDLHLPYVHTPLKQIDYQGLVALEKNSVSPNLQDKYNRFFTLPSDIELPANATAVYLNNPTIGDLERLRNKAKKEDKFYLAQILIPYTITDTNPEMYRCLKQVSPFHSTPSDTFRIAIHVRRGEEFVVDSARMLPNSYYISATMRIVDALKKLGIPFSCELYTEVASKAFVVTPQSQGMNGRLAHSAVIDPKMNRIEDFDVIPNLHKFINTDPIEALNGMATADGLIISRSSFSYFAALFSNGVVVYNHMVHKPLKDWLITDNSGSFSSEELLPRLQAWQRNHQAAPSTAPSN
jgi:hypothetical protein